MEMLCKVLIPALGALVVYYYFRARNSFDPKSLRGKRVLVTGASSGIGEQVAYYYAKLGARLVITARRTELLAEVSRKCKSLGAKDVYPYTADMAVSSHRQKLMDFTLESLGGLDVLILNHALMGMAFWKNTAENMTSLLEYMNVNFVSYVHLTSLFMESLEESKGQIGVVSSLTGKIAVAASIPYCASKHALHGFYSGFRQELLLSKSGVSITLLAFGCINTQTVYGLLSSNLPHFDRDNLAAQDPANAAEVLVRAVAARKYEVIHPMKDTFYFLLWKIAPGFTEGYLTKLLFTP